MITEKVGFEPTVPFGITGFQDQLLKPLGHLSISNPFIAHVDFNYCLSSTMHV